MKSKVLVIYYSKYGFTQTYAKWLAEDLGADIPPIEKVRAKMFGAYDVIILGSSVYAGFTSGLKLLARNTEKLADKRLVIFTCGIADVSDEKSMAQINANVLAKLPESLKSTVKIFNLQGGIYYPALSFKHRLIMSLMNRTLTHRPTSDLTENHHRFLASYGKNKNFTERENILGIVQFVTGDYH
jgi:menaquinone-dependent protoporphyrinogen IX oxidase